MGTSLAALLIMAVFFTGVILMYRTTLAGNVGVSNSIREASNDALERTRTNLKLSDLNTDECELSVKIENIGSVAIDNYADMDTIVTVDTFTGSLEARKFQYTYQVSGAATNSWSLAIDADKYPFEPITLNPGETGLLTVDWPMTGSRAPEAIFDTASVVNAGTVMIDVVANDTDSDGEVRAVAVGAANGVTTEYAASRGMAMGQCIGPGEDMFTIDSVTQGANGAVAIIGSQVSYTHDGSATTSDSFNYTISDLNGGTDTATVAVTVGPSSGNAPVAAADVGNVANGGSIEIDVLGNDTDPNAPTLPGGDTLDIVSVTQGAVGSVAITPGGVRYTHSPLDTSGATSDSFTYTVSNAAGDTSIGTVIVVIAPTVPRTNNAPVAVDDDCNVDVGSLSEINVLANDTDADGDTLTIVSVTQGAHGTVTITSGGVTYTHDGSATSSDSFTYTVSDGNGGSAIGVVSMTIGTGANNLPVPVDDSSNADSGASVSIDVLANDTDADGDTLTLVSVTQGSYGTVAIDPGGVTYTHDGSATSSDSFTYAVSDGNGGTATGTVFITIGNSTNNIPVAVSDACNVVIGGTSEIDVLANDTDADGDTLTIISVTQASHGTVTITPGGVTYTHDGSDTTADYFTYTVSDGNGGTATGIVSITIDPLINNAPVAVDDDCNVDVGGTSEINVLANDTDADGDTLTIISVTQGSNGTVTITPGGVTYTHDGSATSSDSFTYTVSDGNGGTAIGVVSMTIGTGANNVPVAVDDDCNVDIGGTSEIDVLANDTDADGDTLTIISVTQGSYGTVTITPGGVTYVHDGSATSSDSFTYAVSDGNGGTATGTVSITIGSGTNNIPVAVDDDCNVDIGGTSEINVLANDTDADGDTLTIISVTQASNGTVTITPGGVTYTHDGSATSLDSFTYTVSDGNGGTAIGVVSMTIGTGANNVPVAVDDFGNADAGASVSIDVLANDTDADGDTLSIVSVTQGSYGTVVRLISGGVAYTHDGSATTADSFTYALSDGNGGTATGTVSITIEPGTPTPTPVVGEVRNSSVEEWSLETFTISAGTTVTWTNLGSMDHNVTDWSSDNPREFASPQFFPNETFTHRFDNPGTFQYVCSMYGHAGLGMIGVITVEPSNNNPLVAVDDSVNVEVGGTLRNVGVRDNDTQADGVWFSVTQVGGASHGETALHPGGYVIYSHDGDATSSDSFTYTVSDNLGNTATATVSVTIAPIDDPIYNRPVAVDDVARLLEVGGVVEINVLGNDIDDDSPGDLWVTSATDGDDGMAVIMRSGIDSRGTVEYRHDGTATTEDSFTYTVSDSTGLVDSGEVEIIIGSDSPIRDASLVYAPLESFTISAGTTVRWTNIEDMGHNVNASDGGVSEGDVFNSPPLGPNETYNYTFNTPGTFTYFCNLPYHFLMVGVVTVE